MKKPSQPQSVTQGSGVEQVLLASGITASEVDRLLKPYGFVNSQLADSNFQAMAGDPHSRPLLAKILPLLLSAVAETADPDQALNEWDRYLQSGIHRSQLFDYLAQAPPMVHLLCMIFGNSPAMAQTLIRDPFLVYWLAEEQVLTRGGNPRVLEKNLRATLETVKTYESKLEALRRFKRREMLRIGIRDLLRFNTVPMTVAALSDLASLVIQVAYELVDSDLKAQYGMPMHKDGRGRPVETGFSVIGLGKLGGWELNYSSDVDLIYVFGSEDGETYSQARQTVRPNVEYFCGLARELTRVLTEATPEGFLFRVDLRLRPEGDVGAITRSLSDYEHYYKTRGRVWERMALLKANPLAGSSKVGSQFLRMVRPFVLGVMTDGSSDDIVREVRSINEKIQSKMAQQGELTRNVKLGVGGVREIEFVAQTLQLLHAKNNARFFERSTLKALTRFTESGHLRAQDADKLSEAYLFLRDVEHKLQIVHDMQTHSLPSDRQEIEKCAVRLGYPKKGDEKSAEALLDDHLRHTQHVRKIFEKMVPNIPPK